MRNTTSRPRLKWRIGETPTGRYRSFESRAWPHAEGAAGAWYARIEADAAYEPRVAETTELRVYVADRSTGGPFKWRRLKARPVGVKAAKELVAKFFALHPEWLGREESK
jgi:hypothetical protein